MKKRMIYLCIILPIVVTITLSGCMTGQNLSGNLSEKQFIAYRIYTLFDKETEIAIYNQQDQKAFSEGKMTASQYIENEKDRIEELEEMVLQMKDTKVPMGWEETHDFHIQSIECTIRSYEYNIAYMETLDTASLDKAIEYKEKAIEYIGKMAETTPKE